MASRFFMALGLSLGIGSCASLQTVPAWPEVDISHKPHTRWWWLGSDVDSSGLRYNLGALHQAGIGGVEITPIYGVKGREAHYRKFLSPEWMRMLEFTKEEAQRLGMRVDMNTGTGWPFGGPSVALEQAASRAIFNQFVLKKGELFIEKLDAQGAKDVFLSRLMIYLASGKIIDATEQVGARGLFSYTPEEDARMVALYVGKTIQQVKRAAPGGEGLVLNHFDKTAVQHYLAHLDSAFQHHATPYPHGFFNDSYEVYGADWTPELLAEFKRRRGYALEDHFPALLQRGSTEASTRIITDYRKTLGEILHDNFTTVWTDWAHSRGAITRNQAHGSPANLIDLYAAVDVPEGETFGVSDFAIPGLRKDDIRKKNDGDPTVLKYASSAANITGKQLTSAETFTWLTEHFRTSLSQCKPEIDQMFTAGINHVYFHGSTYSPEEAEWPGWKFYASVDMSPTNTFWKDAPAFFNYVTRVQSFLQTTRPDNDFLLYFPFDQILAQEKGHFFTTFPIHGLRERLPDFCGLAENIMSYGFDTDYISDAFVASTVVRDGKLVTQGGATYKAIVVPGAKVMDPLTLQHLLELAKDGATVIFTGSYPEDVPGWKEVEARRKMLDGLVQTLPAEARFDQVERRAYGKGQIITGPSDFMKEVFEENREEFRARLGGQMIRKRHDKGHLYFLTLLKDGTIDQWVPLAVAAASAEIYDPMTGKTGKAAVRQRGGKTEVYLQLKPGQSLLLKTFTNEVSKAIPWMYYQDSGRSIALAKGWNLTFPASYPEISGDFPIPSLGSWTSLDKEDLKINAGTGSYSLKFEIEKAEGKEYLLDLGDVRESARIRVNGQEVGTVFAVPFETNIGPFLVNGENTLEVDVTNLPANRIRDYDRRGVNWRIFHEINFVSITYRNTKFDQWEIMPSGLLGPVKIREMRPFSPK